MGSRIVIAGGTGFLGRALAGACAAAGAEVIVLSRQAGNGPLPGLDRVQRRRWLTDGNGDWHACLDGADAVVNLTGQSIAEEKWTPKVKQQLRDSRVNPALALGAALEKVQRRPPVYLQASGIGYYGDQGEMELDESGERGAGFLAELSEQWEAAARRVGHTGVRVMLMRLGVVLGRDGGMLAQVVPKFKAHLAAYPGSGKQWFSWIHLADAVAAMRFLMGLQEGGGVFNLTAPEPVRAKAFYRALGRELGRSMVVGAPALAVRALLGQMGDEMMLASQRVKPQRLRQAGFEFKFSRAEAALHDLFGSES